MSWKQCFLLPYLFVASIYRTETKIRKWDGWECVCRGPRVLSGWPAVWFSSLSQILSCCEVARLLSHTNKYSLTYSETLPAPETVEKESIVVRKYICGKQSRLTCNSTCESNHNQPAAATSENSEDFPVTWPCGTWTYKNWKPLFEYRLH